VTESLTKEERIQLSTRWPPDTKLYLKLLRVHDSHSEQIQYLMKESEVNYEGWRQADTELKGAEDRVKELESELSAYKDTVMTLDSYRLKLENQ
jgi:hypothetical protein